jgi:hypothetical protein
MNLSFSPADHESEKASNSYLMSLLALHAGREGDAKSSGSNANAAGSSSSSFFPS